MATSHRKPYTAPVSPCVSVCQIDAEQQLCIGCLRTLDEIAGWSRYNDAQKREVLGKVAARRAARGDDYPTPA